ncbi:M3B subfamily peptidase [Weissella ceti]|uniref:M3B subfamily peptidase n=2 Tax=Weissella TaxID=46255 RepID=A0A075U0I8_9LACO|nr:MULTISPECIES: M3 family oligoendopeptidase [Weissella]AIG66055.1 M3B subfamily peptidase [Weissella tructae]AIM63434.1 M3B subfamily peptidase [Weissella ceti]AIM64769.1 M3B subfamily peptidase [Weissella ceti]
MAYSQNWNLETIYAGGVEGQAFQTTLNTVEADLNTFAHDFKPTTDITTLVDYSLRLQALDSTLRTLNVFLNALTSADYTNPKFRPFQSRLDNLAVSYQNSLDAYSRVLAELDDQTFIQFQTHADIAPIAFYVAELRQSAGRMLAPETEQLVNQLQLDGLTAWSSHYDTISATLEMPFTNETGDTQNISAGQALNLLDSYPDNAGRAALMDGYESMWGKADSLTADTLNHLAGSRLTSQEAHGYTDFLEEPLELNRMSRQTLDTMWQVVDDNKAMFTDFFTRKAQLLGLDGIGWQDQVAPLTKVGNFEPTTQSYDEVANFIVKNFGQYSPKMATFAQSAFDQNWIEAEDRPGKQPGGWMDSLPDNAESRIFMTFTGSVNDASTLAHELGHAFHSSVLTDLPVWRDAYAMNIAETASTFAELLIADANIAAAQSDAEKVVLLDAKMTNPVSMFMNIRARYLFEKAFYTERAEGYVPAARLNELMAAAQAEAFNGLLTKDHPHFWSSKLHFYIDSVPFYNFPYTFGYLFSAGVYAWVQTQDNFEDAYIALLRDSAHMTIEDLAQKHLGVDLTQPDFWQAGADLIKTDIQDFIRLSDQFVD